jgi:UDP:flavonoid glycosyltransferase YjiC (YdhE family)
LPESGVTSNRTTPDPRFRWAFFTYANNWGDCSRAIEVGKAMSAAGHDVRFFIHGGRYEHMIRDAGLKLDILKPIITEDQDRVLMDIDQHRVPLGTPLPFTEVQLRDMVEANLDALRSYSPDGAYCGLDLSCFVAVQHMGLPSVTFVPTALCPAFYRKGLASFPNAMETNPFIRYLVPSWVKRRLINRVMLGQTSRKTAVTYNEVRRRYGLEPVYNHTDLVRGDLTLLPDLPELSGLDEADLPEGYAYTGPVFALLDMPVPEEVYEVFGRRGRKNLFVAMGSSGGEDLLKRVVEVLRTSDEYNVVCAVTTIVDPAELGRASENFFATRFLPAHLVNEMADLAVTHGGQGTVQTAAWAGTPVVGIGMQWEQQANLDGLARAGMGIRIPLHSVSRERLLGSVRTALSRPYVDSARRIRRMVRARNGAAEAVKRMNDFVVESGRI